MSLRKSRHYYDVADRVDRMFRHFDNAADRMEALRDAVRIVGIWNARLSAGRELWFYPTIGAAIAARHPWLSFYCPGCNQIGDVDLRRFDRHERAPVSSLIPSLVCTVCGRDAPFARLVGLSPTKAGGSFSKLAP